MRQNKLSVSIHFVWATWDRSPLITEAIERDLHRCIQAIAQDRGCVVLAVGGMEDHVHPLVSMPSTLTMADLMGFVKGGSSRLVTGRLASGEWFKWQGSYGAFSVSPRDTRRVVEYIQQQKAHHAEGSIWPHAEETHVVIEAAVAPA